MTRFTVHTVPGSPFARSVMAMLEEKGADWQLAPMGVEEVKGPRHLALHPLGKLPALEWDGHVLYETQAILRYLDETLSEPSFTPDSATGRMKMNQLIGVCGDYLFPESARTIVFQRVIGPALLGMEPDEAASAASWPRSPNRALPT
jgi:glutathione S-transferase